MGLCLTLKKNETIYLWTGQQQDVDELVALSLNNSSKEDGYNLTIYRDGKDPYQLRMGGAASKDTLMLLNDDIVSRIQMKSVSRDKLKMILAADDGVHILHKKERYNGDFIPPEWKCTPVKMADRL